MIKNLSTPQKHQLARPQARLYDKDQRTHYCIIAEWPHIETLANVRPNMIATLDSFRDSLEDLADGLGVTDPVSALLF